MWRQSNEQIRINENWRMKSARASVTAVYHAQNRDIRADHYPQQTSIHIFIFEEMNVDPTDPKKADRDRFVLSKGHTAPGLLF